MFKSFESFIGARYVRARKRKNFISFISFSSIAGIAVGVMAIITVLSVWNGFEVELRERTLGMVSHATVYANPEMLNQWEQLGRQLISYPEIVGVAPFFREQGMVVFGQQIESIFIQAVIPDNERTVSSIEEAMTEGSLSDLNAGSYSIVLGKALALKLGVSVGEKIVLVAPQANITPVGILPRMKRFQVSGIFDVGINEYDGSYAMIHLEDGKRFYRKTSPLAIRLKTSDVLNSPMLVRQVLRDFNYPFGIVDWTQENSNFFRSLALQKVVMFIILMLIVGVAAFNIVSTLIMVVVDKQAEIAVLRTMGASPGSIMKIFIVQGMLLGVVGVLLGNIAGFILSENLSRIVGVIENMIDTELLPCDIYYICEFPSSIQSSDMLLTSIVALVICSLATIYPALKASRAQPAEALRYD